MKLRVWAVLACLVPAAAAAQNGQPTPNCAECDHWNAPQKPFQVFGNTYYVGVAALSSILVMSGKGDILIDGDLNESAPQIAQHIQALGFRLRDIKLILNSHAHYDHAGGLAQLQRLTGARVLVSPWSARVLKSGHSPKDDPQYGILNPIAPVANVGTIHDGETVHVGPLALTAHFTPGHTRGGTSWTWQSCEAGRCLNIVYADSLSTAAGPDFHFSANKTYPDVLKDFDGSFATVSALPCDILLTPHPDVSHTMERLAAREQGKADAFVNPEACRQFVAEAQAAMAKRVTEEKNGK